MLHPVIFRILRQDPVEFSTHAKQLRYLDRHGRIVTSTECSYRFASYATLHQALLERFDMRRYHLATEVTDFVEHGDCVEVELSDGTRRRGALLVCADGIQSGARRKLLSDVDLHYAGYVGWRGTAPESSLSDEARTVFADSITYCVVPDSHILVYPIPGAGGQWPRAETLINWVWYRNVSEGAALQQLLTDREGVRHAVSVGAGGISGGALGELHAAASAQLPRQLVELVGASPHPFVQVVFDVEVPRMAFGHTALIGDAAFALRPHIAVGTAKAAEDGLTLAQAVGARLDDIPAALQDWEQARLRVGRAGAVRARDAGIRSQFDNSWRIGDPLPFGLHEPGDSRLA